MDSAFLSRRDLLSFGATVVGAIAVTTLAGCSPGSEVSTSTTSAKPGSNFPLIKAMQDRGHAIVGVFDSPPSSMVRDGKPTGYNVDIVMAVLAKYGITKVEAFQSDFAGQIPGLQAKRMDICCAGLLLTDQRCQTLAMSAATYVLLYSFAVKPGNPKKILSIADMKGTGAKLAVESATTQERVASGILSAGQLVTVASRQDGADAVRIGRADAFLAPRDNIVQVLKAGGDPLDVTEPVPEMGKIGAVIAMRQEDAEFAKQFDEDFAELVKSGKYDDIMKKYGADPSLIKLEGVKLKC